MRILVLAPEPFTPPHGGGKLREYNLLRRLAEHHRVDTLCFLYGPSDQADAEQMRDWGDVETVLWTVPPLYVAMTEDLETLSRTEETPFLVAFFVSDAYRAAVHRRLAEHDYDLIYVVTSMMGQFLLEGGPPAAVDLWNLETLVQQRAWERGGEAVDRLQFERMAAYEQKVFDRCAAVIPVSEKERQDVLRLFHHPNVVTVENGVDTREVRPSPVPDAPRLVFTGAMQYEPNTEGVVYFLGQIWPLVLREAPDATLSIVGQLPPPEVTAYDGGPVRVTGFVPEVAPYIAEARACIVPLLSGGGTRLKILEAMASGRPVVSTSIGAEGLDVEDGVHLLLADTPEDFARATLRVLNDRALAERLAAAGRRLIEERYDWDLVAGKLEAALAAIASEDRTR